MIFNQCCGSGIPDPGKYLGLQRINLKNKVTLGSWPLGGKFQESFSLKFLLVQEKIRLLPDPDLVFSTGSGSLKEKSNFLLNY